VLEGAVHYVDLRPSLNATSSRATGEQSKMMDKVVRVGGLFLAVAFLYVFYLQSSNGRFQTFQSGGGLTLLLDTRNGDMYHYHPQEGGESGKWIRQAER
jgi:hypothetical protein